MSRQICAYFGKPGGCRNGNNCKFSHESSAGPSNHAASTSNRSGSQHLTRPANLPRGVCSFFWQDGKCRNGFSCKFKHEQQGASSNPPAAMTIPTAVPALSADQITDIRACVGLTTTPSALEIHSHLRRFMFDNFVFPNVLQIYAFLKLLSATTTSDVTWVRLLLMLYHML